MNLNSHKTTIRYYGILIVIIILSIISQTGCSRTAKPVTKDNYFLDTTCTISIYSMNNDNVLDETAAETVIDEAYKLCSRYDKQLSRTYSGSDISRINAANGQWVSVDPETISLLENGIKYSEMSGGLFDITIGSISSLWDFHSDNPKLPDEASLQEALTHVDYSRISIRNNEVCLLDPSAQIDLGGIAKGYIADRLADYLESKGVDSALINLGGNIEVIGHKPDGSDWNIGIEKPYSDRNEEIGSIKLNNQTIVTSGVYERYFELDGRKYHHILSTSTGYPVDTGLDSVTLVADKGKSMDIDALSTICLIKGSKEGKEFIENQDGIEALFCLRDGSIIKTSGMKFQS